MPHVTVDQKRTMGATMSCFTPPRPRHYSATSIQPWFQVLDHEIPRSPSPIQNRVSSPLRHPSVPPLPLDESFPPPSSPITASFSASRIKGAAVPATLPLRELPNSSFRDSSSRLSTLHGSRMDSPARRWVRWMGKMGLKNALLPSIVFVALATRWLVGLGGYSGPFRFVL